MIITYEDPILRFPGDLEEFALEAGPNRVLGPQPGKLLRSKTGTVAAALQVFADSGALVNVDAVLKDLLNSNESNGNPGRFKVIRSKDAWNIVPTEVKNEQGKWVPLTPIMETKISMAPGARKALDAIQEIREQVSQHGNSKIIGGRLPFTPLSSPVVAVAANNEPARDVLNNLLINLDGRFSWRLYYDYNVTYWGLNITVVLSKSVVPAANPSIQSGN